MDLARQISESQPANPPAHIKRGNNTETVTLEEVSNGIDKVGEMSEDALRDLAVLLLQGMYSSFKIGFSYGEFSRTAFEIFGVLEETPE